MTKGFTGIKMALLSNMTIERTTSTMTGTQGSSGGYRYTSGKGIQVDNDNYVISAKIDDFSLVINQDGNMSIAPDFLLAEGNIHINANEEGHLVFTVDEFVSQFDDGDKIKYDSAVANLANTQLSLIEARANIGLNSEAITSLTARMDALDTAETGTVVILVSDVADLKTRVTAAEADIDSLEERMDSAEALLAVHTTDIGNIDQYERATRQIVDNHSDFLASLTGLDADFGGINNQLNSLRSDITALQTAEQALSSETGRVTVNEGDIAGLKTRVGTAETNITTNLNSINSQLSMIEVLAARVASLAEATGGADTLRRDLDAATAYIDEVNGRLEEAEDTIGNLVQSNVSGALDELSAQIDEYNIPDLIARVEDMENDTSLDERVTALETDTSAMDEMSDIRRSIESTNTDVSAVSTNLGILSAKVSRLTTEFMPFSTLYQGSTEKINPVELSDPYDPMNMYFSMVNQISYSELEISLSRVPTDAEYDPDSMYYYTDVDDRLLKYVYDPDTWQYAKDTLYVQTVDMPEEQVYVSAGDNMFVPADYTDPVNTIYYTRDPIIPGAAYVPYFKLISDTAAFQEDAQYYNKDIFGNYAPVAVDSDSFEDMRDNGLYVLSNWSEARAYGLCCIRKEIAPAPVEITPGLSGMLYIQSGLGNSIDVEINSTDSSTLVFNFENTSARSTTFTLGVLKDQTVTIQPRGGSGIIPAVYATFFTMSEG